MILSVSLVQAFIDQFYLYFQVSVLEFDTDEICKIFLYKTFLFYFDLNQKRQLYLIDIQIQLRIFNNPNFFEQKGSISGLRNNKYAGKIIVIYQIIPTRRRFKASNSISGHKQFQALSKTMSSEPKVDVESLSSLSVDPNQMGLGSSNIFGGRKSSFDYVNILKDSDQLPRRDFRNSLDILTSNINTVKTNAAPIKQIIQIYNEENKVKIQQSGLKAMQIGQVYSQSEEEQRVIPRLIIEPQPRETRIKLQTVYNESKFNYHSYFPHDLAEVLKERQIPLQYVRGLLMVRDQKQIKTTRRLKVERYLEKRRKKTWSRKICYNCRQKVAEQRLRIKGKFIKKRRAMQILGLTIPIDTALLKQKLYAVMKNKDNAQIQQLLKTSKKQKMQQEQENDSIQEQGSEEEEEEEEEEEDEDAVESQMVNQKNGKIKEEKNVGK